MPVFLQPCIRPSKIHRTQPSDLCALSTLYNKVKGARKPPSPLLILIQEAKCILDLGEVLTGKVDEAKVLCPRGDEFLEAIDVMVNSIDTQYLSEQLRVATIEEATLVSECEDLSVMDVNTYVSLHEKRAAVVGSFIEETDNATCELEAAMASCNVTDGFGALIGCQSRLEAALAKEDYHQVYLTLLPRLGNIALGMAIQLDAFRHTVCKLMLESEEIKEERLAIDAQLLNARLIRDRLPSGHYFQDISLSGQALKCLLQASAKWPDRVLQTSWTRVLPIMFKQLCQNLHIHRSCQSWEKVRMQCEDLFKLDSSIHLFRSIGDVTCGIPVVFHALEDSFDVTIRSAFEDTIRLSEWMRGKTNLTRQRAFSSLAKVIQSAHKCEISIGSLLHLENIYLHIHPKTLAICLLYPISARPSDTFPQVDSGVPEGLDGKMGDVYRLGVMISSWFYGPASDLVMKSRSNSPEERPGISELVKELGSVECQLCADVASLEDIVECSLKHFFCVDCLRRGVKEATTYSHDELGSFRCPYSSITSPCWIECEILSGNLSQRELSKFLDAQAYSKTRSEIHKAVTEYSEKVVRECVTNTDARELLIMQYMEDNVLPNKCPRCGQHFDNFDACSALECCSCGCAFCAWCLVDCGDDAHDHVNSCSCNPMKLDVDAYSAPFSSFLEVQNKRRDAEVETIMSSATPELRQNVLDKLKPRLLALNETNEDPE
jgi:hypothetical protein